MEIGEIVFYIVIVLFGLYFLSKLYNLLTKGSKIDQEYDRKLKESLADEFIIDPETGAKLTLEQAESGHWIAHDNEFNTLPESDIEKLFTEEQKNAERGINYLKEKSDYRKQKLTENEIQILEKTKTLSKYDDWSYSDCFRLEYANGFVFLPAVKIIDKEPRYFDNSYHESQVMFWLKLNIDLGHYYLRGKSKVEKFFDLIKNDDDLKLKNYESFTFRKSTNLINIKRILKSFEGYEGLEIELMDSNLFVKSQKLANLEDIKRIEGLIKKVC
jgi:hypothetical protein